MIRGWWSIEFDLPHGTEVDDATLEHIAELIKGGFTSGEICIEDEAPDGDEEKPEDEEE